MFRRLPSIGRKTAERLCLSVAQMSPEVQQRFIDTLTRVKEEVHPCPICNHLTDQEVCSICSDEKRDRKTLLVVEDVSNLLAFEKSGSYKGLYHVLNGLISPMKNRGPEEIGVKKLWERVHGGDFKEIIFAISPTVEGETTMLFLADLFKDEDVKLTKIASGIPVGGNLGYYDEMTLLRAVEDRRDID